MEIAAITAALSGIKNASDIAKLIKSSGASLEAAEIKLKLAELIEALADAKIEIASFREVISEKEAEIRRLQAQIDKKGQTIWEAPYYFVLNENDEKDGPYCQRCYDSNKKLIRLQSPGKNGYWQCNECKSDYKDSTYKETIGVVSSRRRVDWSAY